MDALLIALGTVGSSIWQVLRAPPVPNHAFFSSLKNQVYQGPSSRIVGESESSRFNQQLRNTRRAIQGCVVRERPLICITQENNCTNAHPHVEDMADIAVMNGGYDDVDDDEDEDDGDNYWARILLKVISDSEQNDRDEGVGFDDKVRDGLSEMRRDELPLGCDRKPWVFENDATMTFYVTPMALSQLAFGLWTRPRPCCVIINTSIPRGVRFDDMDWSDDSLRMLNTPNAGGNSLLSEVLSCEMLHRCLGSTLVKTEMEIKYLFAYQPITDYTVCLPNLSPRMHVGVSVTRAFAFKGAYRRGDCRKLLLKKLRGILASTRNVIDERIFKQILHVWVPNGKVARTVQATYKTLPIDITRNTVVIISVVNAPWVFSNRRHVS
ncbi:hypothetical protein BGZ94_004285 [Podila epigama]|nr:hypothetical protein BGZ94_004285 [Podila epigama]